MISLNDARRAVETLIDFTKEYPVFEEFQDDLFNLLDALNEDNMKETSND
jgi:hypothetical protein